MPIDAAIEHSVLIRVAPEVIYDALASAEAWDAWFTQGATVDPRPGGAITFRWVKWGPDEVTTEDRGQILEAKRPSRLVFQWHPDNPSYATTVEFRIDWAAEGAIVRLREWGYEETEAGLHAMLECASGWGEALTLLKVYLEHGVTY
jgi:uncharacterized protein YndB with AHSA1/START domain